MTRCDYDAVFYRLFCITLLAIAFTFTVILTNVFIDIDGLLYNKQGKQKAHISPNHDETHEEVTPEPLGNDYNNYGDNDDSFRTKRSIESSKILFHIKDPKLKNILTNRLSHLLEELDAEESKNEKSNKVLNLSKEKTIAPVLTAINERKHDDKRVKKQKDDDILHLTMHNILLQGIIGHMNMNDVHKRMDLLMHNLEDAKDTHKEYISIPKQDYMEVVSTIKPETKPISKLIKYTEPTETIENNLKNNYTRKATSDDQSFNLLDSRTGLFKTIAGDNMVMMKPKNIASGPNVNNRIGSKIFVKTVIDIKSVGNERNDTMPKVPIQAIMELVLNGKSIKFTRPEVEIKQDIQKKPILKIKQLKPPKIEVHSPETTTHSTADLNKININDLKNIPKDYLNKFVVEYFKQFPKGIEESTDDTKLKNITKRLKRNVKVKNKKGDKLSKPLKVYPKKSPDDDDLVVEIETHYDSKSMKGDKKKKLINSLIEKIQQAINSTDINNLDKKVVKKEPNLLHVKKRQQNPLEYTDKIMINKISVPMNSMAQRQLNPRTILKTLPKQDSSISVRDQSGYSWSKKYLGPAFLAGSKTINSAEMSELDVDYKNVMKTNGIPQRLQKPLNTDMSEETMNPNSFYDIGNMKFLVKDIDGSGFIAFNQYIDEPPEPEVMQLFTGVEKAMNSYQQNADQREQNMYVHWTNDNKQNATFNRNDHIIVRRSIKHKHDYHSNEYKIIYDGNALPYDNYRDIYEKEKTKTNIEMYNKYGELPLVLDDNIFNKNLKPAEIFGLANMFRRKRRSLATRKITNLRNKIKLNKFINADSVSSRRMVLNKKRKKRQINKIRIIASDYPHKHSSDENVYVVSDDENVFADRAIIKEVDTPKLDHEEPEDTEILPYHSDVEYDVPTYRIFDGKSRQNALMLKYPHIFMEEITRSREEISPESALLFHKIPSVTKSNAEADVEKTDDKGSAGLGITMRSNTEIKTDQTNKSQKVEDINNALQSPKTKYKVTLKIKPKNATGDLHGGFKEIHTSINKRFNKNGLQYLSLVNVSEISKVFQLNKTKDLKEYYNKADDGILSQKINDQQDKMQLLLREHQKNIDEQLNRLNEEKVKIESILVDDNNTIIPHCDYLERLLKKITYKNVDDKLLRYNEATITTTTTPAPTTTTLAPTTTTVAPIITTLSTTKLTITTHTSVSEKLKKKILHTIERNENLTDQILKKIDKNTELLQSFLKKLSDRVETKLTEYKPVHKDDEKAEHIMFPKFDSFNSLSDWRFRQSPLAIHPNYFMRRNDSHVIPFVYAYQQPLSSRKLNPPPVANIVYQGHIHANNIINEKEKINSVPSVIDPNNQTRFFIDEIESDYKVIPMNNVKINKMPKNTTNML